MSKRVATARRRIGRWLVCVATLVALVSIAGQASSQGFRRDAGLSFPGQTIANPRGSLSLHTNPAGLTDLWGWEARAQLSAGGGYVGGVKGAGAGLWGALAQPLGSAMAFSWEHLVDAVGEPADGGASVGVNRFSVGAAFRLSDRWRVGYALRLSSTAEANVKSPLMADIGVLFRPWSWISVGARLRSLSVAHFGEGEVLDSFPLTRYGWGLALRPFAGSDRLTLAMDIDWPAGDTIGDTTVSVASRIVDGLELMLEHRTSRQNASTGLPRIDDKRTLLMVSLGFGSWGAELGFGGVTSQLSQDDGALQVGLRMSGDHPHSFRDRGQRATVVKLKGAYTEHGGGPLFADLVMRLDELARRPNTRLVVLRAEGLRLSWAQVEELRNVIGTMRRAGKRVVMYADGLGTRGYMVAVACDKIGLPAYGTLTAKGVGAAFIGLRQALSRVGVALETVRFGAFKSAPEQFTRTSLSDNLAATLKRIVEARWKAVAEAIALGRGLKLQQVQARLAAGAAYPADALKAGLIDAVAGPKTFEKKLKTWGYLGAAEHLEAYQLAARRPASWARVPRIGLVAVTGTIVGGRSGTGPLGREIGGAEAARHIATLQRRDDIKAIALRINSPGGSVAGSDIMYRALREAAKHKPVHASMASVAASGGYWTAMGADRVLADRATVTGSIGIFTLKPNFDALAEKLGVGVAQLGAGPMPHIMSTSRPWTASERAIVHKTLRGFYGLFLERVSLRRGIKKPKLLTLAEGQIWLGDEAKNSGLVDEIGGVRELLSGLRQRLALAPDDPVGIEVWPKLSLEQSLMRSLGLARAAQPASALDDPALRPLVEALQPWLDAARIAALLGTGTPLALSPMPVDAAAP